LEYVAPTELFHFMGCFYKDVAPLALGWSPAKIVELLFVK
jgi:hypothetical protein